MPSACKVLSCELLIHSIFVQQRSTNYAVLVTEFVCISLIVMTKEVLVGMEEETTIVYMKVKFACSKTPHYFVANNYSSACSGMYSYH